MASYYVLYSLLQLSLYALAVVHADTWTIFISLVLP